MATTVYVIDPDPDERTWIKSALRARTTAEAPMHRLVVRTALRKHVPLRAGVQNPQRRFEHLARGDGLATGAIFAHLKKILKLDRLRLRGPSGASDEFLLAATAQNLRRMARGLDWPPSEPTLASA